MGGARVVKPELLQELDTTEIAIPFALGEENTTEEAVQKYRDVLKSTVIMQDTTASYILLGIEDQTDVHYAMPVRNIIYDALQYGKQVSEVAKKHKNQKDKKALSKFLNDSKAMIMDNDAARVIRDITNTPIYVPDGKGEIDMCKAVKDMLDESKTKGMAEGKAEGRAEGFSQLSKLIELLSDEERYADIKKIAKDAAYRDMLMKEYHLI